MATNRSYSREDRRAYQAAYRAAGRDSTRVNSDPRNRPFVAVDGEGGTHVSTTPEYHAYWLLTAGTKSLTPRQGDVRLRTADVLRFLCSLPRDPIYVVFFGDYDVTKILEDVPSAKLERLLNRSLRTRKDGRGTFPVDWGEFQFDYLPRKEFKVRQRTSGDANTAKPTYGPWFVLNDVGPFFQCRFVEAIEKWGVGTVEEWEHIARQKERRDSFDYSEVEVVRAYNLLENKLLAELMEKFREACIATGYVPNKWQGPGQLAESMFRAHSVPMSRSVPLLRGREYQDLLLFARNAFYGGRPELAGIGPVTCPVFQFDINSAYPAAMREVPCLEHGRWIHEFFPLGRPLGSTYGTDAEQDYTLVRGRFCADLSELRSVEGSGRPPLWYGLPVRDKSGSISYPSSGAGWYWNFEVLASRHQRMVVDEQWRYVRECECQPLGFVSDVYEQRQAMGKDGPGIVLKLSLNSLYGKTAQSIGSPKYANPIWASFITAHCRTKIQDFIHGSEQCSPDGWCGSDVLMIATDSVTTTNPRPDIEASTALGEWSREDHPRGVFLIQPGLYFGSSGKHAKTRGVPRSVVEDFEGEFRTAFARMSERREIFAGNVRVPQRLFCGIRLSLHRRNFKILGQWLDFVDKDGQTGKVISFDWRTKRAPYPVLSPTPERSWLVTFPYEGSEDVWTVPYSKNIGGLEEAGEMRAMMDEQPEEVRQIEIAEMA